LNVIPRHSPSNSSTTPSYRAPGNVIGDGAGPNIGGTTTNDTAEARTGDLWNRTVPPQPSLKEPVIQARQAWFAVNDGDDSAMSNPPPSDVNPNDDFEWTRQPYEDQFTDLSWADGRSDQHGNPIPLRPPHLSSSFDVERLTPEQLDATMKTIGVTDNPAMSDDERLLLRHAVAYSWAAFDEVMRPVDGPPASKFKDVHQKSIRIAPYRLTPEKIECLRAQIEEWEKAGILKTGSTQSPRAFPVILLRKKGGTPGTSDAYRTIKTTCSL